MKQRQESAGFTLMEVIVSALIIGSTMIGMSTVLTSYSLSRSKINALAVAQNIVQAEIDDVLLHTQIENSLVNDSQGRNRPVYLPACGLTESNYFYCNFPYDPDHNTPGMIWLDPLNSLDRFSDNGYYDAGGTRLFPTVLPKENNPSVVYIARFQLFGATGSITGQSLDTYISGATSPTHPNGLYLDTTTIPTAYMIADSRSNDTLGFYSWKAGQPMMTDPDYNAFTSKVFVVRVYERKVYVTNPNGSFLDPTTGVERRELTHGYVMINGKIRL